MRCNYPPRNGDLDKPGVRRLNHREERENLLAVIGAGPAGLQAAIAAANAGAQVTLIDGYQQPGGQYYRQLPSSFHRQTTDRHQAEAEALFARLHHPRIALQPRTQVLGIAANGRRLWLHGPDAPTELEAAAVVLATGAYDRPVAFPGWTLTGVMSLGAAQAAVKGQRVLPGNKFLLVGTGPLLLATGAALTRGGAKVAGILEGSTAIRSLPLPQWRALWGQWARLREGGRYLRTLRHARVPFRLGWGIVEALGTPEKEVSGAVIAPLDEQWRPVMERARQIECDTICIGYGFIPETALGRLAGAEYTYESQLGGWVPVRDSFLQTTIHGLFAAGDGAGIGGAAQSTLEGQIAGTAAASLLHMQSNNADLMHRLRPAIKELDQQHAFQRLYGRLFTPEAGIHTWAREDTILCRCESITRESVEAAVALGAQTVTAVKGLTGAGMGSCQGRLCSHLIAGQIARITGKPIATCGQFSIRAPIHPFPMADGAMGDRITEGEP